MISVSEEACIGCLECKAVCPNYVFGVTEVPGEGIKVRPRYAEQCFACGHCIAVCPTNAVSHPDLPLDTFEPLPPLTVTSEAIQTLLLSRRSIRDYKADPVPRERIEALLTAAAEAGSSSNGQTEGFIVVEDQACLRRLEALVVDVLWKAFFRYAGAQGLVRGLLTWLYGAETVREAKRYHEIIKHRTAENELAGMVFRNAPVVLIAHGLKGNPLAAANCALALRNIELLALTLGLGTCWVGFLTVAASKSKRIRKLLGLAPGRRIYGALMLGYPNEQYRFRIPRKARSVKWIGGG